nr:MAG TPA: hypothetical protein [Caudoviricetes sp.]
MKPLSFFGGACYTEHDPFCGCVLLLLPTACRTLFLCLGELRRLGAFN